MALKGLILDVDGVLTDTVPLHYRAWHQMFTQFGYQFDEDVYREKVDGKSRLEGVQGVMGNAPLEVIEQAGAIKQGYYLDELESTDLQPFPDAVRLMDRAKAAGLHLAAASGSRNAPTVLAKIGLLPVLESVVTGADVEKGKPEPDIFLVAAARLSLQAAECVVFEDAESGIEAAHRGGFVCVGVYRGSSPLLGAADRIVSSLDDVDLALLAGLLGRQ